MQIEHRALLPFKIIDPTNQPLREGANVIGKVLKLLPDGLMELQVGQRVLTAGTTAELKEGATYRFTVTSAEGQPVLKIVSQEAAPSKAVTLPVFDRLSHFPSESIPQTTRELLQQLGQKVMDGSGPVLKQTIIELVQLARAADGTTEGQLDRKTSDHVLSQQVIQATNETGRGIFLFQLPQFGPFEEVDVTMEAPFDQKEFNPDHARIAFYLKLPKIGEIALDLLITDRKIAISVFHPDERIAMFMSIYQPVIEQRLHDQGYTLIRFEQVESEKERVSFQPTDRNGRVDYQI
ncbi:hypothetical protein [Exiguobacterium antarcticum]|uniref:Flagellar hook-length control protein-like C-terminal domain-containing protein n=1 Tax=Exiguobacterium antarcticum TaxID=132920 RepID=A0ABT6QYR8_9BACL|nr:hypothetical protein [Exiguobacterium antarcticum]AFS70852.1 Hypothetical protein Eab7_1744 [Exiguobacterium antarcticum B7]MDI3233835.1 hypothetical protein [Exiguobacterium antarcticum]